MGPWPKKKKITLTTFIRVFISVYVTINLFLCLTFPWTAESCRWFPGQLPVSAPLLCTCRYCHSEHTHLWAPRRLCERWPEQVWAPRGLNIGLQLQQSKHRISWGTWRWTVVSLSSTSPVVTIEFHPDVPPPAVFQWPFLELLQSVWVIQQNLEEIESLRQSCTALHLWRETTPHLYTVKGNDLHFQLGWYFGG